MQRRLCFGPMIRWRRYSYLFNLDATQAGRIRENCLAGDFVLPRNLSTSVMRVGSSPLRAGILKSWLSSVEIVFHPPARLTSISSHTTVTSVFDSFITVFLFMILAPPANSPQDKPQWQNCHLDTPYSFWKRSFPWRHHQHLLPIPLCPRMP